MCLAETREYFVFFYLLLVVLNFPLFQNLPLCLNSIWSGCCLQPKLGCNANLRQYNFTQETGTPLRTETSLCAFYTVVNFQINTTHRQPSHSMYNIITSWHVRLVQNNVGYLTSNIFITFLTFLPLLSTQLVTQSVTNQPQNQPTTQQHMWSLNHSFSQAHFPVNELIG